MHDGCVSFEATCGLQFDGSGPIAPDRHEQIRELIGQVLYEVLTHLVKVLDFDACEVINEPLGCVDV